MSKAKPQTIERAKKLKALGLIDYDLRKPLTENQRRNVGKLAKRFDDVIKNPSSYFKLHNASIGQSRLAKQSNLAAYKNHVFVPKRGYSTAKIIDDRIVLKQHLKKTNETKKESILLSRRTDMLDKIEAMSKKGALGKNEFLMVRIGDHAPFGVSLSYEQLSNYVSNWKTDDIKKYERGQYGGSKTLSELQKTRDELITQMYIVSYDKNKSHLVEQKKTRPTFSKKGK